MKSIILFFTILITSGINAQSIHTASVMNNANGEAVQLLTLPWDQSQLGQIKRVYDQSTNTTDYVLEEVSTGVNNVISIPLCSGIKSKPTVLDDGILFSGESSADGKECMFFDGVNTTVFDLNIGASSSNPIVYLLQERVFLIANSGNGNQLYEFDQTMHTVAQITNGSAPVFRISAVWNDDIYYNTRSFNSVNSEIEHTLMKATLGSVPSYTAIRSISFPSTPMKLVYWNLPQIKWGKLYLTEDLYSPFAAEPSDLGIISIDQSNQITTVHEDLQSLGKVSQLFEWDGALWTYGSRGSATQLYKSVDGNSFSPDVNSGMKSLKDHHISENNKLYFRLFDGVTNVDEIAVHYGALQTLYTGEKLNFILEENNILYVSHEKSTAASSIMLMHTNYDITEEVSIALGTYHTTDDVSVMFENEFTFLFKYSPSNIDVLKVTGSPQAGLTSLSNDLKVYPNPVEAGGTLFIDSDVDGEFQIYASDNRVVANGTCHSGSNQLDVTSLSTGMYFLTFQGAIHQLVIK